MAVEEIDEPRLGDDAVIVQPEAAGICGSEIEGYLGRMSNRVPPLVMGHEFAGRVVDAGRGLGRERWSGHRVVVNPLLSCRACVHCSAGARNLCAKRRLIGVHVAGGFAERAAGARDVHSDAAGLARERSAELVVDAVGATATRRSALDLVRPGGAVVLLGLHEDESALSFHRVVRDQVALQGSFAYTDADFVRALDLLASGKVALGGLATTLP